jgi:hypothetical protein
VLILTRDLREFVELLNPKEVRYPTVDTMVDAGKCTPMQILTVTHSPTRRT